MFVTIYFILTIKIKINIVKNKTRINFTIIENPLGILVQYFLYFIKKNIK
jgi:hypothetical protein